MGECMKIYLTYVNGQEFSALVDIDSLPKETKNEFINHPFQDIEANGVLEIIDWDDQYPIVEVTSLKIKGKEILTIVPEGAIEKLAQDLENSDAAYDWWISREASRAEAIYDYWKENGEE
jgi:hypothetical protein